MALRQRRRLIRSHKNGGGPCHDTLLSIGPSGEPLSNSGAFRVSDTGGLLTVLAEFALFVAGFIILNHGSIPFGARYWMTELLLGTSLYRMFVILHECGHNTLFRKGCQHTHRHTREPLLSDALLPLEEHPFSAPQMGRGHRQRPDASPPAEVAQLSKPARLLFRVCWKCLLPVPYVKYIIDVFWGYPLRQFRAGNRAEGWKGVFSVLVCTVPHAVLLARLGPGRYIVLFAPMLLVYYVIFEMVNLPQHGGIFPYLSTDHPASIPPASKTRSPQRPNALAAGGALLLQLQPPHRAPSVPDRPLVYTADGHQEGCRS